MASPGITTVDTIIERVIVLVREKVNAEVDRLDTRNNTVSGAASPNSFTTPDVASAAVQAYLDRAEGHEIRIVVTDEGEARQEAGKYPAQGMGAEPQAQLPTLSRAHVIGVTVIAINLGGSQTTAGASDDFHARRVCNRVADALLVVFGRYPQLDVPSLTLGVLVAKAAVVSEGRAEAFTEDDHQSYGRTLKLTAWCIEDRAA